MARWNELGKLATTCDYDRDTDMQIVTFHSTQILEWDSEKIILNSGGWKTSTTKTRLNQGSNQFGLDFGVYQEKFVWYVSYGEDEKIPFVDGMVLNRQTKAVEK